MHENFDEDTTARSGVVFIDFDAFKGHPRNGVGAKQMSKKAADVAQPIGFIPMNGGVVISECGFEAICPYSVQFAESLSDKPIESRV